MQNIDEVTKRLMEKHHQRTNIPSTKKTTLESNYLSKVFTRVLMGVIFVLISTIYIKWSDTNLKNYQKSVFETSISFTTINNWYEKYFGSVLPINIKQPKVETVGSTKNDFKEITKYQDGWQLKTTKGSGINTLNSGIVVFMGEKENYGNVTIIQGIDGVDIWYGNITNVNLSLYDYVDKNSLIGEAKEDNIYLVLTKDGNFLDYNEYIAKI